MSTPSQYPVPPSGPTGQPPAPHGAAVTDNGYPTAMSPAGAPAAPPAATHFTAPYAPYAGAAYGVVIDTPLRQRSSALGTIALLLGLAAAVVIPVIEGFLIWPIGRTWALTAFTLLTDNAAQGPFDDLSWMTQVADQVLWAELSFYVATGLGSAAFILGIIAIAQRRGRGAGIGGVVTAALGPLSFGMVVICIFLIASASAFTG